MIKDKLKEILCAANASPFLFVGSGFSRRYIKLEDWRGLLSKFTNELGYPFEYYLSGANSDLTVAARLISQDFYKHWWESEQYKENREKYKSEMRTLSSPLRVEICEYLTALSLNNNPEYADEINLINNLNVDGIITTNWDKLLEKLFPDYKVYIGQQELLFSNTQLIGEIYKIHGCSSNPNSLILTDEDYSNFNAKNAYLAAKLITIFVEHPIIFIGYSLSDKNIFSLLSSIAKCIGENEINKLGSNLIFISRSKAGEKDDISPTYITVEGTQIPITRVQLKSFISVYEAIHETKRKMPVSMLRFYEEQLYEVIRSGDPDNKIAVIEYDQMKEGNKNVEFVIGIGVAKREREQNKIAEKGYKSIQPIDLFRDLLLDENEEEIDPSSILKETLKNLSKASTNIPIYKYLYKIGITNDKQYNNSNYKLNNLLKDFEYFKKGDYYPTYKKNLSSKTADEIIEGFDPKRAMIYLSFLEPNKANSEIIKRFLIKHLPETSDKISTEFRKLACYYDKLVYGWW